MVEAAENASRHLGGMQLEAFLCDRKTQAAVERELAILGEAAKRIPDVVRARYPDLDWRAMAGMRDVLNHSYFQVDGQVLWRVVHQEIPVNLERLREVVLAESADS